MARRAYLRLLMFAFLTGVLASASLAGPTRKPNPNNSNGTAQTGFTFVIVNGRKLTGPNSAAQSRAGRIQVPIAAIARAFGDRLGIDVRSRAVRLERQDGVTALFDGRSGQVRENDVAVLTVTNTGEIVFTPDAEEMMLPVEIASAVFNAAMRFDTRQNAIIVSRGTLATGVRTSKGRRAAELYRADYEINASGYSGSVAQNLTINATGRVGDGRFVARSISSGTTLGRVSLRNAVVEVERPNGQRFGIGDLGTGGFLPFSSSQIRGGMVALPIRGVTVSAFGGKANSGTVRITSDPVGSVSVAVSQDHPRFDTNVFGASVTKSVSKQFGASAGVIRFGGQDRAGDAFLANASFTGQKLQLQADVGTGYFRGLSTDGRRSNSTANAIDLSATYQISENLAVHGRLTEIGRNFLTPQSGTREPVSLRAAGVTYSPVRWLTASVNASTARRPGDDARAESFVTAAFGISPGGQKPRFFLSHTASSSRLYDAGSFTLFNASKEFRRWRLYVNATRIKTIGPANANVQIGSNVSISDRHSIEATQGFGSRRSMNGMLDWRASNLFVRRLGVSAGMGYSYHDSSKLSLFERVTASMRLPRESALQISYMNTVSGAAVLVQLRGMLFKRREALAFVNAPLSGINSLSTINGRVYQDVDGNGVYEPGVDRPQSEVKVRVDGSRYVVTDANGLFSFEAVAAGNHSINIDLLSVRADLTMIDGATRELELSGGRTSGLDFRLVRTGRISGRVFFDRNGNSVLDEGESPLTDVRVLTASGRDTLTDGEGYFVIADLSPGEHVVFLDEKTLPDKTVAAVAPMTVQVFAGKETDGIVLTSMPAPTELKRFGKTN